MPQDSLQHFPLGQRFPDSPHAVCVSLPTMADVIGYEEKDSATVAAMKSGYPRFKLPGYVEQLANRTGNPEDDKILVASDKAAEGLLAFLGHPGAKAGKVNGIAYVHFPADPDTKAKALKFLQHTGSGLPSRWAEEELKEDGHIGKLHPEETIADDPFGVVTDTLSGLAGVPREDILLCNSGMNAFYAAFLATAGIQRENGRGIWIQLGWLYLDTSEILKKFLRPDERVETFLDVFDIVALEAFLDAHKGQVAGIVTEAPTNPMIKTPDMERIYTLAQKHGAILIADPTSATPANVDLLPYADVLANSLTKYAGNQGDILAGAVFVNPSSPYCGELQDTIPEHLEAPYPRDLQRLAHEIGQYQEILDKTNANTLALAEFFQGHPGVAKVHWAYSPDSIANYEKISRRKNAPGGLITIEPTGPLQPFYDRLRMLKSPSFGTEWSMACPFLYLAHYDLVSSQEGRAFLLGHRINPDLVRVSVGTEPAERLIAVFREALEG
jgi:cystathionine gamma-synthase